MECEFGEEGRIARNAHFGIQIAVGFQSLPDFLDRFLVDIGLEGEVCGFGIFHRYGERSHCAEVVKCENVARLEKFVPVLRYGKSARDLALRRFEAAGVARTHDG